ncbi:MAG: polyphosphate polymerase domain-containing protein [Oscillospiraceae bacterium]|jgi:hypothetical protein|nr:polyphosphate polymerase domain-containing protein [Oscillospiraceae bacterium]
MAGQVFDRYEKKYMLSPAQYEKLRTAVDGRFSPDSYGLHTICSVYYDTEDYTVTRLSADKPVYKEKLRLRSYTVPGGPLPGPESMVFLELKKKFKGVVNKRRISLTLREARAYLQEGIPPENVSDAQIFREIDWFVRRWQPSKGVLVAYDRIALAGPEEAPRMTFDRNIRWRTERPDPGFGTDGTSLLPDWDGFLMEVKIPGAIPVWLADIFDSLQIYPASFSKVGNIYACYLNPFLTEDRRAPLCLKASLPFLNPALLPRQASLSAPQLR